MGTIGPLGTMGAMGREPYGTQESFCFDHKIALLSIQNYKQFIFVKEHPIDVEAMLKRNYWVHDFRGHWIFCKLVKININLIPGVNSINIAVPPIIKSIQVRKVYSVELLFDATVVCP